LRLIGQRDRLHRADEPQALAFQRAAVRDALVSQGADADRLQVLGSAELSSDKNAPLAWQRRYVEFEPIVPTTSQ
jgi:outer membrane protein OmpA-like peptidoglycan-associated protein